MKVLFFDPYVEGKYGNARYVADLFHHEEFVGCTFYTCSPEVPAYLENLDKPDRFFQLAYDQDSRLNKFGGALSRSSFVDKVRAIKNIATYTLRFKDLCKRESIDIVHCNSIRALLTIGIGAKLAGCKIVLYIKSNLAGYFYCLPSFILADTILFQTETNKVKTPKSLAFFFKSKFKILKNAIDISRIENTLLDTDQAIDVDIETSVNNMIYIGSIVERKGLRHLVNSLKILKEDSLDFKLYIVGDLEFDSVHTNELKDLINKLDLKDNIRFLGYLDEPLNLLKSMDLLVLPSLDEGVPKSVIESICIGVPVVATDVGGTTEIVKNLENGIIVEPGDEKDLYSGIMKFFQNKKSITESAKDMSLQARSTYSFSLHAKNLSLIYKGLSRK